MVLPISALQRSGLQPVVDWLEGKLPEGPSMYPKVRCTSPVPPPGLNCNVHRCWIWASVWMIESCPRLPCCCL